MMSFCEARSRIVTQIQWSARCLHGKPYRQEPEWDHFQSVNMRHGAAQCGDVSLSETGKRSLQAPELLPMFSVVNTSNHCSGNKKLGVCCAR